MYLIFERNCQETRLRSGLHVIAHSVHHPGAPFRHRLVCFDLRGQQPDSNLSAL